MTTARYASVILDVDSTLCGIEGIDWIAARRGPALAAEVSSVTRRAMDGELPMDAVFGERLATVRPTVTDVEALSRAYREHLAPGARNTIGALRAAGVRLELVTGAFRAAIEPLAFDLGFAPGELHAIQLTPDERGRYAGFDVDTPLIRQGGKAEIVRGLRLARPALAVGDGSTDLAIRPEVDAFAAFVGFVRRDAVVAGADFVVTSFAEIGQRVLGD